MSTLEKGTSGMCVGASERHAVGLKSNKPNNSGKALRA